MGSYIFKFKTSFNGSKLKHNSFLFAKSSEILVICIKLDKDRATKATSSTYPNAPAYVNPTWQPRPDCFKSENSSN